MVNRIDGDARRRELARAVLRIVVRDGLGAASVRSVARETGLAAGSVRHFFGTQGELVTFAMHELERTIGERITRAAAVDDPEERAVAVVSELLPLTATTRDEAVAHLQFVVASRFDPALRELAAQSFAAIREVCRQVVEVLATAGALPADVDRRRTTATLAALLDGLAVELLFAPELVDPEEAADLVRAYLRRAVTLRGEGADR